MASSGRSRRGAAEVRLHDAGVAAHLVRRARRDHLAELEHDDPVADRSSRAPCRGRSGASSCPRPRSAGAADRDPRSRSCRGPPRARRGRGVAAPSRSPARHRRASAVPGSAPSGIASAIGPRSSSSSACSAAALSPTRLPTSSAASARNDGRWAATVRFSRTVRSSNSSVLCQVRASPRRARACGGIPVEIAARRARRGPVYRTNPVIASMNVVLPAPFGPIRPTSSPSSTTTSTSSTACTPPKRTERPVVRRTALTARAAALGFPLRPRLSRPVERAGHALGILDQREDEHDAAEEEEPVPGQAEPLVERVGEEPLRGDEPGEDGARDERDAPRVGERDQAERQRDAEAVGAHRAEVVRVQRAGDAGDQRADAERDQLDVPDVDRRPGRGTLVRADCQHASTEDAAAHRDDEEAENDGGGERDPPEHGARQVAVEAAERRRRPEVDAEEVRIRHRRAGRAAAPGGVDEAEVEDGHRGRDRDDGEGHPAHAQRRHRRHEAEQHGSGDAGERCQREADPASTARCETVKPATPASASWTTEI